MICVGDLRRMLQGGGYAFFYCSFRSNFPFSAKSHVRGFDFYKTNHSKIPEIRTITPKCESKCVFTEVPASSYDRKPRPDLLTLSTTLYYVSVLCDRLSMAWKNQIWFSGNEGVNTIFSNGGVCDQKLFFFRNDNVSDRGQLRLAERHANAQEWAPPQIPPLLRNCL